MTKHKPHDRDDPIGDYVEWTEHRYDPGYYTGGRLTPATRAWQRMFSSREKRALRYAILAALVASLVWTLWRWWR